MPPTIDAVALRARLAPTMARPGRPMPSDAIILDTMFAQGKLTALSARLRAAREAAEVVLDMNWEQARIFDGAGFLMVYAYLYDLWRVGSSLPGETGDQMKQSAGMQFVYALDLIRLDGVKCADISAAGHRQDQLFGQNRALIAYIRTLPRDRRMTLGTVSLAIESATASLRQNDDVLCSGGLDDISEGLKAQGDRPLEQVPNPPGMIGKTYNVPSAPGYTPKFIAGEVWRVRQSAIRQSLPAFLTRFLTTADDPSPSAGK